MVAVKGRCEIRLQSLEEIMDGASEVARECQRKEVPVREKLDGKREIYKEGASH